MGCGNSPSHVQPCCPRAEAALAQLLPPWQQGQEGSWGWFLAKMKDLPKFDSQVCSEIEVSRESDQFFFFVLVTLVPALAAVYLV